MTDAVRDPSEQAFVSALFGEDELGVVVRAHIHIEARLLELLEGLVFDSKSLERMDLDFAQRVNLAVALGLKSEHAPALLALGSLRNAFAHRLDTHLSEARVKNLYAALSATDKQVVQLAYERTKAQQNTPHLPAFKKLDPKTRFILIAVALRAMLILAVRETSARGRRASSTTVEPGMNPRQEEP
jgi:hypothetical protein